MLEDLVSLVERGGYGGIFAAMFAENVFPPIPSELIMPLAGFRAAEGGLSLLLVICAGTAGSVLGAFFWYYIGSWVGLDRLRRFAGRHGRLLTLTPDDITRTANWFDRHGPVAVFFGRMVPGIRTLISIPAGIARMPVRSFFFYTLAGSAVWTAALAIAGYLLQSQYDRVATWVDPASKVVLVALVVGYLYRVAVWRPA